MRKQISQTFVNNQSRSLQKVGKEKPANDEASWKKDFYTKPGAKKKAN